MRHIHVSGRQSQSQTFRFGKFKIEMIGDVSAIKGKPLCGDVPPVKAADRSRNFRRVRQGMNPEIAEQIELFNVCLICVFAFDAQGVQERTSNGFIHPVAAVGKWNCFSIQTERRTLRLFRCQKNVGNICPAIEGIAQFKQTVNFV